MLAVCKAAIKWMLSSGLELAKVIRSRMFSRLTDGATTEERTCEELQGSKHRLWGCETVALKDS